MIEINKIYLGDTFELIKDIPDNSIDTIICDGAYGVTTNDYDKVKTTIQEHNLKQIEIFSRVLKANGSLFMFGKPDCIDFIDYRKYLKLNSKIVWYQPARLSQGRKNLTNNYDIICYFSKGTDKKFNLDDIRVPQNIDKKQIERVQNVPSVQNGSFSKTKYNELGKNPGDVWTDIKQLTYKSKELVSYKDGDKNFMHTIQKPEKLIERLIKMSTNENDLVLDVFSGVGTTSVVCKKLNRNFIGFEINEIYYNLSLERLNT
jgi:site-specific DNA-methyltransferase (adenine-specific)/adenine-specific DNA-methyltransferase